MIIGILGGTGRTGEALREHLLGENYDVISLVRHPEKFISKQPNDTFIQGSATNLHNIENILTQAEIIIDATSVGFFHKKPTSLYSTVAQTLIKARSSGKAKQLIIMSSCGTHHGRKLPRPANWAYELFLGDVANDKEKAEKLLEASSLPRTIIKSPILISGPRLPYQINTFDTYTPRLRDVMNRSTLGQVVSDLIENKKEKQTKIVPYLASKK